MFVGQNLARLRELNGFSRKDLSNKLSVTEQVIWQYEKDATTPSVQIINQLSLLFQVKSQYFFKAQSVPNQIELGNVAYRTGDRESRKKTKFEVTYLNFIDFYLRHLESFLQVPQPSIIQLHRQALKSLSATAHLTNSLIEKIAFEARQSLKVKRNQDLMYNLELSGIYIFEKDLGLKIDAYSTWTKDSRAFIVLGNVKKSAVRRNFDLAHELGHLLLHSQIDMEELSTLEYKQVEKEANLFASAFLLPKTDFQSDFKWLTHHSNPDAYLDLKKKYFVSIMALELRAYHLNLLTYQENRYFFAQINRKGYRKLEPLDDKLIPAKPGKVKSMLKLLLDHNIINLTNFLDQFRITLPFISKLFSFPDTFLERYTKSGDHQYFSDKNIIRLDNRNSKFE